MPNNTRSTRFWHSTFYGSEGLSTERFKALVLDYVIRADTAVKRH